MKYKVKVKYKYEDIIEVDCNTREEAIEEAVGKAITDINCDDLCQALETEIDEDESPIVTAMFSDLSRTSIVESMHNVAGGWMMGAMKLK